MGGGLRQRSSWIQATLRRMSLSSNKPNNYEVPVVKFLEVCHLVSIPTVGFYLSNGSRILWITTQGGVSPLIYVSPKHPLSKTTNAYFTFCSSSISFQTLPWSKHIPLSLSLALSLLPSSHAQTTKSSWLMLGILNSSHEPCFCSTGSYVTQVTATDADDPTYGNSARVVYSILHGQPYFSVDPKSGNRDTSVSTHCFIVVMIEVFIWINIHNSVFRPLDEYQMCCRESH